MADPMAANQIAHLPRKASREARRLQLSEATIETIGPHGYARTTLTDVARQAGLSHGLVNFHFETKQKLFGETLRYLAEEYLRNWPDTLAASPPDPADQPDALTRADFNDSICSPGRLSAVCAFWGEPRPLCQQECSASDARHAAMMDGLCAGLIRQRGYDHNAEQVSRLLRVSFDGVWLEMMALTDPDDRDEAPAKVFTCTAAFFPRHFSAMGLIA